jgi:hypothetical protein
MNFEKRAEILADTVIKYQELVLVYQRREQDYAMYSHRIAKIFRRLAEKASPEDAAFAGRCISPAVDISMEYYSNSQAAANSKLEEIEDLLEALARLSEQSYEELSRPYKFFHALSRCVPAFLRP